MSGHFPAITRSPFRRFQSGKTKVRPGSRTKTNPPEARCAEYLWKFDVGRSPSEVTKACVAWA